MPTTESGLAYPSLSDAPNGPAQVQQLADDITARYPRGILGYAQITANQLGIGTSAADVAGLVVAVTVGTGRRIRVSARVGVRQNSVTSNPQILIQEGSTVLDSPAVSLVATGLGLFTPSVILSPNPGQHTYKVAAVTGGGTMDVLASGLTPAYILVEDIGGV